MSRINTNVSSLVAQNALARSNADLQMALNRLSTGLRINSGKDDPAGLIASENLRRDITSIEKAISNTERANQMIATADSALGQVNALLNDIRGLVTEAANSGALSDEQIAANQLQVDASLEAINRIAQVTTFQGQRLLDGSLDFIVDSKPSTFKDMVINQATIGSSGSIAVSVTINTAATQATLNLSGSNSIDASDNLKEDLVLKVSGPDGSEVFTFDAGASRTSMINAINLVSDATGVTAADDGATGIDFTSSAYGSSAFVQLEVISEGASGNVATDLGDAIARDAGTDIDATVNGVKAKGDGNTLSVTTATLDLSITVNDGSSTNQSFNITGGGAIFQLGPNVVSTQQSRIGIQDINTGSLGGPTGRLYQLGSGEDYALATDPSKAAKVVDEVITKVASLRGRLGAFQRTTLESNLVSLKDTQANLTEAESSIRDADFAAESARLTRAQILVQAGTAVLTIANQNPQNVLALLR